MKDNKENNKIQRRVISGGIEIPIRDIIIDPGLQMREHESEERIKLFQRLSHEGEPIDPIVLFQDESVVFGGRLYEPAYWVADGFHRLKGIIRDQNEVIRAVIRSGNRRAALEYSMSANEGHGMHRKLADRKNSFREALRDAEWSEYSANGLSKLCGASHETVSKMLEEKGRLIISLKKLHQGWSRLELAQHVQVHENFISRVHRLICAKCEVEIRREDSKGACHACSDAKKAKPSEMKVPPSRRQEVPSKRNAPGWVEEFVKHQKSNYAGQGAALVFGMVPSGLSEAKLDELKGMSQSMSEGSTVLLTSAPNDVEVALSILKALGIKPHIFGGLAAKEVSAPGISPSAPVCIVGVKGGQELAYPSIAEVRARAIAFKRIFLAAAGELYVDEFELPLREPGK
jgi:hypothetical protein